jgi:hypothetical protein
MKSFRIIAVVAVVGALSVIAVLVLIRGQFRSTSDGVASQVSPAPNSTAAPVTSGGREHATQPLPRFVSSVRDDAESLDVRSPKYDPIARMKALKISGRGAFPQEPRTEAWARVIEAKLPDMIKRDMEHISKDIRDVRVECKSGICKISWSAPAEIREPVQYVAKKLYGGAAVQMIGGESLIVFYRGGAWGPLTADEALRRIGERRLEILRGIAENRIPPELVAGADRRYWPPPS